MSLTLKELLDGSEGIKKSLGIVQYSNVQKEFFDRIEGILEESLLKLYPNAQDGDSIPLDTKIDVKTVFDISSGIEVFLLQEAVFEACSSIMGREEEIIFLNIIGLSHEVGIDGVGNAVKDICDDEFLKKIPVLGQILKLTIEGKNLFEAMQDVLKSKGIVPQRYQLPKELELYLQRFKKLIGVTVGDSKIQ